MTDAPERIWAARSKFSGDTMWWPDHYAGGSEYIRVDLVRKLLIDQREACAVVAEKAATRNTTYEKARRDAAAAIRSIPLPEEDKR